MSMINLLDKIKNLIIIIKIKNHNFLILNFRIREQDKKLKKLIKTIKLSLITSIVKKIKMIIILNTVVLL